MNLRGRGGFCCYGCHGLDEEVGGKSGQLLTYVGGVDVHGSYITV